MWTQSRNKVTREYFYNPVRQNAGHVRALSAYVGLPEESFVPVVVFGDRCVLKKVGDCPCPVIKTRDVRATLKRIARKRGYDLTDERQRDIVAKLESLTHASDAEKAEHVEQIKVKKSKTHPKHPAKHTGRP